MGSDEGACPAGWPYHQSTHYAGTFNARRRAVLRAEVRGAGRLGGRRREYRELVEAKVVESCVSAVTEGLCTVILLVARRRR